MPKSFTKKIFKKLWSQMKIFEKSDQTLKINYAVNLCFFKDFFPISDFGHFFCPFLKNENISWKKIFYKTINCQSNLKNFCPFCPFLLSFVVIWGFGVNKCLAIVFVVMYNSVIFHSKIFWNFLELFLLSFVVICCLKMTTKKGQKGSENT